MHIVPWLAVWLNATNVQVQHYKMPGTNKQGKEDGPLTFALATSACDLCSILAVSWLMLGVKAALSRIVPRREKFSINGGVCPPPPSLLSSLSRTTAPSPPRLPLPSAVSLFDIHRLFKQPLAGMNSPSCRFRCWDRPHRLDACEWTVAGRALFLRVVVFPLPS